jgi:hypothetical protein
MGQKGFLDLKLDNQRAGWIRNCPGNVRIVSC